MINYNFTTEDQLPVVTTFDVTNMALTQLHQAMSFQIMGLTIADFIIWQYAFSNYDLTIENYDGINNNGEGNF